MNQESTSQNLDFLLKQLKNLAIREHYYCEDPWYSCPKAIDGCSDDSQGEECNCGREELKEKVNNLYNKILDELYKHY